MAVAVKFQPRTTGPLVAHRPQHGCAILLIERVLRINEEKPSVLLMGMLLPQDPHRVNPPFDTRLQSAT